MTIGIFDSGKGGELVAEKLSRLVPYCDYTVVNDIANAPYGEKSHDEILDLTRRAIANLVRECKIIVLACNTATAAAIDTLRQEYPSHTFVGFEPMIKPAAAHSKSKHITLLATYATAYSPRTKELILTYARDTKIDIPTTVGWAAAVDNSDIHSIDLSAVDASVRSGSDSIIIGCTHYIALIPLLTKKYPGVTFYEPTERVASRIQSLTERSPQQ